MAQFWPPRVPRILTGTVTGVTSAAYKSVSFPAGFFTSAPIVTAIVQHPSTPSVAYIQAAATTASFKVAINNSTAGVVYWHAIQV